MYILTGGSPNVRFRGRRLKYATFLAGDGNFHLQQKAGKPDLIRNPSLIGDYGFWAPQKTFEQYQGAARAAGPDPEERVSFWVLKSS